MVHYLCYNGMQGVAPNITGVTGPSTLPQKKWNRTELSHSKNDVAWPLTRTATNPQFRDNHFLILIYNWIWWCPFPWSSAPTKLIHDYKPLVPQLQKDVQAVYKRKHFQQKAQTFKSLISQCEASCCVHKIGSNWNVTDEMIGKITDNDSGL